MMHGQTKIKYNEELNDEYCSHNIVRLMR